MSFASHCARAVFRGYHVLRGPHLPSCRYIPTCSEYAVEAVEIHGATRGTILAAKRLVRCGPWGNWGLDPVPRFSHTDYPLETPRSE